MKDFTQQDLFTSHIILSDLLVLLIFIVVIYIIRSICKLFVQWISFFDAFNMEF